MAYNKHKKSNYRSRYNAVRISKDVHPPTLEDKVRTLSFQIRQISLKQPKLEDYKLTEKEFNSYERHPQKAKRHRKYDFGCLPVIIFWGILAVVWWVSSTRGFQVERIVFFTCFGLGWLGAMVYACFRDSYNKVSSYDRYKDSLAKYAENRKEYYDLIKQKEDIEKRIKEKEKALSDFINGPEGNNYIRSISEMLKSFDVFKHRTEETWRAMTPREFEYGVSDVYARLGYLVSVTQESSDGGVDIIMTKDGLTTYVQCKHYSETTPVHVHEVREFFGVCMEKQLNGFFVHTSSLTTSAQVFASSPGVNRYLKIVSLSDLIRLEKKGETALLEQNTKVSTSLGFLQEVINSRLFLDSRYYWLYNSLFSSLESASKVMKTFHVWDEMQYAIVSDVPESIESKVFFIVLGTREAIRQLSYRKLVCEIFPH